MFSGCTRLREGAVHRNPWAKVVSDGGYRRRREGTSKTEKLEVGHNPVAPSCRTQSHCRLSGLMDAVGYGEDLGDTGNESLFIQADDHMYVGLLGHPLRSKTQHTAQNFRRYKLEWLVGKGSISKN